MKAVSAIDFSSAISVPTSQEKLLKKIKANQEIDLWDVSDFCKQDLTKQSQDSIKDTISTAFILLNYDKKQASDEIRIEKELLKFLTKATESVKGLVFSEDALVILKNQLSKHPSEASKLLNIIADNQPLPKVIRAKLAQIGGTDDATRAQALSGIKKSLARSKELMSTETTTALLTHVNTVQDVNKLSEEKLVNHLNTLKLLLDNGKIGVKDLGNVARFTKSPNKKIAALASSLTEGSLIHEAESLQTRYLKTNQDKLTPEQKNQSKSFLYKDIVDYLHKFSSVDDKLGICKDHTKIFSNLLDEGIEDLVNLPTSQAIAEALYNCSDNELIFNLLNLFNKLKNILLSSLAVIAAKLPQRDENLDSKLIHTIDQALPKIPLFINAYVHGEKIHLEQIQSNLKAITDDPLNSDDLVDQANRLQDKLALEITKLSKTSNAANDLKPIPPEQGTKDIIQLKEELLSLNLGNNAVTEFIKVIGASLEAITACGKADSKLAPQGSAISMYSKAQLGNWAKAIKQQKLSLTNDAHIFEILAGLNRAVELDKGYKPRDAQLMAVLLELDKSISNRGRLLQVKTGEGKTTINAMVAASRVLLGKEQVDIVTSSRILAERDASEQSYFYELLGITCAHNNMVVQKGFKKSYAADVVYGDTLNFQADLLRSEFKGEGIRGSRPYSTVIVDEVDSMMIDEADKIAKIASPICGMEHLDVMFIFIGKQLQSMNLTPEMLEDAEYCNKLEKNLTDLITKVLAPSYGMVAVPNFLDSFVNMQIPRWASSALQSVKMQENVDYVISKNADKDKIIAPVDYKSTGVVQTNTAWSFGLHQFLQVKHGLRITSETITTNFISNMGFFKRYQHIFGMTGTLGSKDAQDLLKATYNIDTVLVPTYKPKIFDHWPGAVADSAEQHYEMVVKSAITQGTKGRAVLIIAETIADALFIADKIQDRKYPGQVVKYLRSDEAIGGNFDSKCNKGDIIVATNLAGRGTDIITSDAVEAAGGLHVIVSFLPTNLRVEEQALGRTSRQGKKGSGEIIINGALEAKKFIPYGLKQFFMGHAEDPLRHPELVSGSSKTEKSHPELDSGSSLHFDKTPETQVRGNTRYPPLEIFTKSRDIIESKKLDYVKETRLKIMEFEDSLFQRFNQEVYQPLKRIENNKEKLMQLEDKWGFWLIEQKQGKKNGLVDEVEDIADTEKKFAEFKQRMLSSYADNSIMVNPAYISTYVLNRLGNETAYNEACGLLADEVATRLDPYYSYQMHYLEAYSQLKHIDYNIRKNTQNMERAKQEHTKIAITSLHKALDQLDNVVMKQLQTAMIILGPDATGTPLHKQLDNKMRLVRTAIDNIKENIEFINNEYKPGKNSMQIGGYQFYQTLFKDQLHKHDIAEFANFGMSFIYSVAAKKYAKDHLSGSLVAIMGVAQVITGALLAIGSAGFAAEFGIGLAVGGALDVINGVDSASRGKSVQLNQWLKGKAIEVAVTAALAGVSTAVSSGSKGTQAAQKGLGTGGKTAASRFTTEAMITFGKEVGKRVLISKLAEVAVGKVEDVSAHAIKGEIKAMQAAIKESMLRSENRAKLDQICLIDNVQRQRLNMDKFERSVLKIMDQRQDQFASIAQQLLTTGLTSGASSKPSVATAITVGSVGVSVAKGISEVRDLKHYMLSGIDGSVDSTYKQLPNFTALLEWREREISSIEAAEIKQLLESNGVLQSLKVNIDKLGFVPGMEGLSQSQSQVTEVPKVVHAEQKEQMGVQPFVFKDLKQEVVSENNNAVLIAPVNSSSGSYNMDLGSSKRYRRQITSLLTDLDKANHTSYEQQIEASAERIATATGERMRGLIRSGIISPVTGAVVTYAVNEMFDWVNSKITQIQKNPDIIGGHGDDKLRGNSADDVPEGEDEVVSNPKVKLEKQKKSSKTQELAEPAPETKWKFDPEGGEKIDAFVSHKMSDKELFEAADKIRDSVKYGMTGELLLSKEEVEIVHEFNKRFKSQLADKHVEATSMYISKPLRLFIEKATGVSFGIQDDPLELSSEVVGGSKGTISKAMDKLTDKSKFVDSRKIHTTEEVKGDIKASKIEVATPTEESAIRTADRQNKQPYDPRAWESFLKEQYADVKITSSTLPDANKKNVKLASSKHPTQDVPFDTRGLPIFDKHAIYDTRISMDVAKIQVSEEHMRAATKDLKEKILAGKVNKNIFTEHQLNQIMKDEARIKDFSWHHHQDIGRMQLIKTELHEKVGHIGGMKLWFPE